MAVKITARKRKVAVDVKFSQGEYLHFKVTVGGPVASFAFACKHHPILESTPADFPGHPQKVYEWDIKASDVHDDDDTYVLLVNFITNEKYTYVVEHRKADDSVIEVLKDLDFESSVGTDRHREDLRVFRV